METCLLIVIKVCIIFILVLKSTSQYKNIHKDNSWPSWGWYFCQEVWYLNDCFRVKAIQNGQKILVDGPKGSLSRILPSLVCCTLDEGGQNLSIEKTQDTKLSQALYGLSRTLVANMVEGVSNGFTKRLEIVGVGSRAQVKGNHVF